MGGWIPTSVGERGEELLSLSIAYFLWWGISIGENRLLLTSEKCLMRMCVCKHKGGGVLEVQTLQRKSNYFKQRFISLAITFLKDRFVPLTEPFSLPINFPISLLIKRRYKDSLGIWTTLLSFIRTWGNNVNLSLIDYRIILLPDSPNISISTHRHMTYFINNLLFK